MNDWTTPFSRPTPGADPAIFDMIASTWGTSVVGAFLDRHRAALEPRSGELVETLDGWSARAHGFHELWDIAFGRAHLSLKEGRIDPVDAALRVALRTADFGWAGSWRAEVPLTVLTVGELAFRDVTQVEVSTSDDGGGQITFEHVDGTRTQIDRNRLADPWTVARRTGIPVPIPSVRVNRPVRLLAGAMLPRDAGSGEVFGECRPAPAVEEWMVETFDSGLRLVQDLVPEYVPWIEQVLHGVVVCSTQDSFHLVSGSWEDVPGYVHISSPHAAIDIADSLIHESSHQYFYLLQRVGPMDDGSDSALYYSPATRTNRPVSRLLMALHAFVNVLELYRAVRVHQTPDLHYVELNEPKLLADIELLDGPLRETSALTELGRGIYEPLVERLTVQQG